MKTCRKNETSKGIPAVAELCVLLQRRVDYLTAHSLIGDNDELLRASVGRQNTNEIWMSLYSIENADFPESVIGIAVHEVFYHFRGSFPLRRFVNAAIYGAEATTERYNYLTGRTSRHLHWFCSVPKRLTNVNLNHNETANRRQAS